MVQGLQRRLVSGFLAVLLVTGCDRPAAPDPVPGPRRDSEVARLAAEGHESTVGTGERCSECHANAAPPAFAVADVVRVELSYDALGMSQRQVLLPDGSVSRERCLQPGGPAPERTAWRGQLPEGWMWNNLVERARSSGYWFRTASGTAALNRCTHVGETWVILELRDGRRSFMGTSCYGVTEAEDFASHPGFWWTLDLLQFALQSADWGAPEPSPPFAWER